MKMMNGKSPVFSMVLFFLFSCPFFAQQEKFSCSTVKSKNNALKSNTLSIDQIAQTERYDVHFYHLDLSMTNTSTFLNGTVSMHGTAREDLDSVWLELFDSFVISDLLLNGVSVNYTRNLSAIKVPVNLQANDPFVIAVSYNGTPPTASSNPLGGSGMTNASSPTWGNQVTWSLSEPFSAFEWFPCKQSLTDKADSVYVDLTVPSSCKAGSNGVLVEEIDLGNGTTQFKWQHRFPIDYYLISVAVAEYIDYTVYADPVGASNPIPIQNFIYNNPATLPNFVDDIDETVEFIELFSELFGLYPFQSEKYGHCMAPISGGMEHQTMTTQGYFVNTLTAHELAHQWFGDHVTSASWSDIWVNEGFAAYAEYVMLEKLYPGDEVGDMADRHLNIKSQPGGSIWVEDSLNANRIFSGRLTYDKGAAFVHTLRYLLNNDDHFFAALRNYQQNHAFGTAIGLDVQEEMENESGLDLAAAFEQWYFGEGFPTYSAKWNVVGNELLVRITQTTSMPLITPLFTNDLDLKFQRAGVGDTIIRFNIQSADALFSISGLESVTALAAIDPENWIVNNVGTIQHDQNLGLSEWLEIESKGTISVWPNPVGDFMEVHSTKDEMLLVKGMDPTGKLCYLQRVKSGSTIDLSGFEAGLFLFQIESEHGGQVVRKIIRR
jgi:aminopeptidase N